MKTTLFIIALGLAGFWAFKSLSAAAGSPALKSFQPYSNEALAKAKAQRLPAVILATADW
jgi:hypothetical protein